MELQKNKGNEDKKEKITHGRKCTYNAALRHPYIFALISHNVCRVNVVPYNVYDVSCFFGPLPCSNW